MAGDHQRNRCGKGAGLFERALNAIGVPTTSREKSRAEYSPQIQLFDQIENDDVQKSGVPFRDHLNSAT